MKIIEMKSFSNIDEVIDYIKSHPNTTCLFRPLQTNYDTLDCLLYLGKGFYSFDDDQNLNPFIDKKLNTLISFQIKKDWDVTFDKYDEIKEKWQSKKKEINNSIENWYEKQQKINPSLINESINHILVIINESICREDSKTRMDFNKTGEKDISYLFTDRINNDYFKFGIGLQE